MQHKRINSIFHTLMQGKNYELNIIKGLTDKIILRIT